MTVSCRFFQAASAAVLLAAAPAPLPAQSQTDSGASERAVEEILVTARRRVENLQEVPQAVSAYSGERLAELGVQNLEDLTALAPNIKVNAGRGTNSTINAYIRGVGQNDPLWGFEPGVGIYLDDVYIARPQGALLDVYDIERVEILRGPQGTLYGKNTLAGAIKYVTRDIVDEPSLSSTITYGSYDQLDIKLNAATPLGENVYVGAAVARLTRDGYGEVVDDGNPQQFNRIGEDVSDKDVVAARANLTFVWGEDSRLRFVADTVQDDSNARGGQRLNDALGPRLADPYDVRNDMPVRDESVEISGIAATFTTGFGEEWDFKAVAAAREGDTDTFIDFEALNDNIFNVPAIYDDEQQSFEVQINYTGERWDLVTGAYLYDGEACGSFDVVLGAINFTSLTQGCVDTQSRALFADATVALGEKLNLNVGLRWNEDDKDAQVFVAQYAGELAGNETLFDPNNLPPGFTLLAVQTDYSNDRTFSDVSPKLGVDYSFNDDVMAYATYSQGFKSGGFDMRGNQAANPDTVDGYDSETVDNYEIGLKNSLLDRTLLFNATAFYGDYKDVQITTQQFVDIGGVPTNVTAVLNAGEQEIYGLELETVWAPTDNLTLTANLGLLEADITEFLTSDPANPGSIIDISSLHDPINAPDVTLFLGAEYRWALGSGEALARLGYQHRGDTKTQNTTASVTDQDAYDIVDLGISYVSGDGHWRFALDAENLFDEEYLTSGYDFGPPGAGLLGGVSQIGFYGPPRTVALSATYIY